MKKLGHSITGIQLGILLGCISYKFLNFNLLSSIIISYCAYKGSNAPDFLEISWFDKQKMIRKSVIKHRTYTHWTLFWIFMFYLSLYGYFAHSLNWIYAISFIFGVFLHLLLDLPNPSGIPFLYPTRRKKTLNLWKSGEHELLICTITGLIVLFTLYFMYKPELSYFVQNPKNIIQQTIYQLFTDITLFLKDSLFYLKTKLHI